MIVQRAFTLAKSGRYWTVTEIMAALRTEGFGGVEAHLAGRSIRAELRNVIAAAIARASSAN